MGTIGIGAIGLAYVYYRLWRTNMDVPPNAEKPMPAKARLIFAIENGIPIKTPLG